MEGLKGFRKFALGAAIIAVAFVWVFIKFKHGDTIVPDLPANVVDLVKWTVTVVVAGNVGGKFAQAAGSKEPA